MRSGRRRRTRNSLFDVVPLRGIMCDAECPASLVLQAHPSSARADSVPRGLIVATGLPSGTLPGRLPLLHTSPLAHVPSSRTPAERSGAYLARFPDLSGLPRYYGGSASASTFSVGSGTGASG